jgi:hypothetical protein
VLRTPTFTWQKPFLAGLVVYLISLGLASQAQVAPELAANQESTVDYEQEFNAAAPNRTKVIPIEHFEIPLEIVETNLALERIPDSIQSELIFSK